jgi:putative nucleotidyltransferase with HDIG domain
MAGDDAGADEGSGLLRRLNQLVLLALIAGSAGLFLKPSDDDGLLGLPQLSVGQTAPRTIRAPRDFALPDVETTERLREEAVKAVLPTYVLRSDLGLGAKARIERAFAEVTVAPPVPEPPDAAKAPAAPPPPPPREVLDAFMRQLQVYLEPRELEVVVRGGFDDTVRDATVMVVRTIHEKRIVDDRDFLRLQAPTGIVVRRLDEAGRPRREETVASYESVLGLDQARSTIDEVVSRELSHLPERSRRAVALVAKRMLRATLVFDPLETQARQERAAATLRPVVIPLKRGEIVVRAEEPVNERQLLILREMTRVVGAESRLQLPAGAAVLVTLLVVVGYSFSRRRNIFRTHRDLVLGASLLLGTLFTAWSSYKATGWLGEQVVLEPATLWWYAAPLTASVMVARAVLSRDAASALTPIAAVMGGLVMDADLGYAITVLVGAWSAAMFAGDPERPRSSLFTAGLVAGATQGLAVVALSLLGSRFTPDMVAIELSLCLVSGLGSAAIAGLLVPLCEVLLGYTSPFHLQRLASLNHPLLRELLVEAPGTYHHAIVVGTLAEAAARAVGANPILARVGGYYHDVGKLKAPRAFPENGRGPRRSEEASAWSEESVSLVEEAEAALRHTEDAQGYVSKHRLGAVVGEIVATHHGRGRLRRLARRLAEGGSLPPGLPLGYRDPLPVTREAVLVAVADAVETAIDALDVEGLDDAALRERVEVTIDELHADGLFEASDLRPRELAAAREAMIAALRRHIARRAVGPSATPTARPSSLYVVPPHGDRPN